MVPRRLYNFLRIFLVVLAVGLLPMGSIHAGEYHDPQNSTCTDCHAAHASVNGQSWTPSLHMLKTSGGEISLCMSCHDGSNPKAPDVVASGTASNPTDLVATQYTSKYGSGAGFFQSDYLAADTQYGHSMAPSASLKAPLSNTYTKSSGLSCSDCHDVHGNDNYRNLVPDPNPANPGSYTITLGTNVKETTPVSVQAPNPSVAYDTGNISFATQSNISAWCADCHDQLAHNNTASAPAHFRGHPSDVAIGRLDSHTDASNWTSPGTQGNTGFGTGIGDSTAGIPRLRFGSPSLSNTVAGSGDTVNCLSCHKAHGSKFKHGLVWPYNQAGPDMLSGCQQCHYK